MVWAELPGGGEEREHGERGEEGLDVEAEQRRRRDRRNAARVLPHCAAAAARRVGWERRVGGVGDEQGEWESVCDCVSGVGLRVLHRWVAD